jgi:tetratricopeptide (TPR) repeat protein
MCEMLSLSELGLVLTDRGDIAGANAALDEALAFARQAGDLSETSWILMGQGRTALHDHDYNKARSLLQESLRLRLKLRETNNSTVDTLEWLANVEAQSGKSGKDGARRAVVLFGAADARRAALGSVIPRVWRPAHRRVLDNLRASLTRPTFNAAWSEGQSLPYEAALTLASQDFGLRSPRGHPDF